jgi:hypothetical protein
MTNELDVPGSVHHSTIHTEKSNMNRKNPTEQKCIQGFGGET